MRFIPVVIALVSVSCSQPAAVPAPAPAATPIDPAPVSAPAPVSSDVLAKADALIAEMRRNEAALQKFDRENPLPPPPRLDDLLRPTAAAAASPTSEVPASATQLETPSPAPVASNTRPERDEQWWKTEMHVRELRLQESVAQMNAARASMRTTADLADPKSVILTATAQRGFQEVEAEFQKWSRQVSIDRGEVERFREDARRAGIPPGWLRWP